MTAFFCQAAMWNFGATVNWAVALYCAPSLLWLLTVCKTIAFVPFWQFVRVYVCHFFVLTQKSNPKKSRQKK
jgi:hypothetical protein